MNAPPKLDGRLAANLEAELRRTAIALRGEDAGAMPVGEIERAIYAVAARIGEEVTTRLDKAPGKQADNFYEAAGLGRDAARAATLPVAFKLTDTSVQSVSAPAGTQLLANASEPVIFETQTRIDLAPGRIEAIRAVDAERDKVLVSPTATLAPVLPPEPPLPRTLMALAGAGDVKMQLNPASGLKEGAILAFGSGAQALHYKLAKVEGDVITIDPPLETAFQENTPVTEVLCFAPFNASSRDYQQHNLYLAHATLLDTESAVSIRIGGAPLPQGAEWQWWGNESEEEPPAWHDLEAQPGGDDLTKPKGKPQKTKINGQESFWIRATLNGKSSGAERAENVTLALVGEDCETVGENSGPCVIKNPVEYDAVAANIPAVVNKPFHPFGREPRLYDAFYIGSKEAFPKIGAKVAMDFAFGGASLGPMAAVVDGQALELFGVGTDGLLYRAQVSGTSGTLLSVPRDGDGALSAQAPLAVMTVTRTVYVAVAGSGKIDVATLQLGGLLTPDQVTWKSFNVAVTATPDTWTLAPQIRESKPGFVLFADGKLFRCPLDGDSAIPIEIRPDALGPESVALPVLAMAAIKNTNSLLVVTQTEVGDPELLFHRIGAGPLEDTIFDLGEPDDIPLQKLAAWSKAALNEPVYLAGTDERGLRLHSISSSGDSMTRQFTDDDGAPHSLVFVSSAQTPNARPSLLMASPGADGRSEIQWLVPSGSGYVRVADQGDGADLAAKATLVAVEGWIAAPHADVGILARPLADPTGVERLNFNVPVHEIMLPEQASLPAKVFAFGDNANADQPVFYAFEEEQNAEPARKVLRLPISSFDPQGVPITDLPDHFAEHLTPLILDRHGGCEIQPNSSNTDWKILLSNGTFMEWAALADRKYLSVPFSSTVTGADDAIFLLEPKSVGSHKNRWKIPDNFPALTVPPDCRLLTVATALQNRLFDAVQFDGGYSSFYSQIRSQRTLRPVRNSGYVMQDWISHAGIAWLLVPEGSILHPEPNSHQLQLTIDPPSWLRIGPDAPANPALSWEYWNGNSWWALDTGNVGNNNDKFGDGTGHFQTNGCVRFTVPPDIKQTEVSGKPGHWIRARLIGGDYGEARISIITTPDGNGGTKQETKRDTSVIRAPYIVNLDIGYCASDPMLPEIIYAEDSLSFVDQTSANEAGLPFDFFVPLSKTMNPPDIERDAAQKAAKEGDCDDPCVGDKVAEPNLCDEPGAYDSCDSPCVWTPGDPRPKAIAASGFVRGVMLGFDKRFSGDTISIYVMVEPTGSPVRLKADIYADGRFRPVQVVSDGSYGLTEPGLLTLAIPKAPEKSNLLGDTSHWLRLWPETDASTWSPRICGLFLNGALTRSVETRTMERLGASNGTAGQLFQLAEAPVDPASLVLRVREILGQQEREGLVIKTYPNGPPGDWVLWKATADLSSDGKPARTFALDAHGGTLRFGDGDDGLIPPLGAELVAERYAGVKGSVANRVKAGSKPTLLASLVGVDSVLALDFAAGGSNTEAAPQARRRASAKLRHGDRILTVADLADFVSALAPDIAQVRVISSARTTKVVVALTGPDPRPLPAKLRGIKRNIKSVSGYGLRCPDGLDVVGPRLLPLGLTIELDPSSTDSFADAIEDAKRQLTAFFDAATGGHDGRGWRMGQLPVAQDIAAALMPIADLAFPAAIALRRTDRATGVGDELPERIPKDVLVRLDLQAVLFERAAEVAA